MKTHRGRWETIKCCIYCNYKFEDDGLRVYRMGVCPKCGNRHQNAGTIAETYDRSRRLVYTGPWYWRTARWEYKRPRGEDRKAAGLKA
jgi:hypothetical protein